ncbi:hypothetical protein BgiMline_011593, partial [Biomphalaria glabrata]
MTLKSQQILPMNNQSCIAILEIQATLPNPVERNSSQLRDQGSPGMSLSMSG